MAACAKGEVPERKAVPQYYNLTFVFIHGPSTPKDETPIPVNRGWNVKGCVIDSRLEPSTVASVETSLRTVVQNIYL